jgi:hypothetical protein
MSVSSILNSNGKIPSSFIEGITPGPSSIPPIVSVLDIGNDASYNSIVNVSSLSTGNLSPSVGGNLNLYTVKGNSFGGLSNLELNFISSLNGGLGDLGASNISSERFMSRNIYIPSPSGNSQVYLSSLDTSTLNLNNSNMSNVGSIQCGNLSVQSLESIGGSVRVDGPLILDVDGPQSNACRLICISNTYDLGAYINIPPFNNLTGIQCSNLTASTISPNCKGIILQSGELNDSSPLYVNVPNIQSTSKIIFSLKSASSVSLGSGIDYLGLESINTSSIPYGFSFYVDSSGSGLSITGGQVFNYIVYN